MRAYFGARGEPQPYVPDSFRTMDLEFRKRLEDWKYNSGKWPFSQQVEDTSHDNTEMVTPDPTKTVELLHMYFNVSIFVGNFHSLV